MKRVVTGVNEQGRSYVVSIEELDTSVFDAVWSYEPGQISERNQRLLHAFDRAEQFAPQT
jgi:hypothetical protein